MASGTVAEGRVDDLEPDVPLGDLAQLVRRPDAM